MSKQVQQPQPPTVRVSEAPLEVRGLISDRLEELHIALMKHAPLGDGRTVWCETTDGRRIEITWKVHAAMRSSGR
jgi:hypothetical protein